MPATRPGCLRLQSRPLLRKGLAGRRRPADIAGGCRLVAGDPLLPVDPTVTACWPSTLIGLSPLPTGPAPSTARRGGPPDSVGHSNGHDVEDPRRRSTSCQPPARLAGTHGSRHDPPPVNEHDADQDPKPDQADEHDQAEHEPPGPPLVTPSSSPAGADAGKLRRHLLDHRADLLVKPPLLLGREGHHRGTTSLTSPGAATATAGQIPRDRFLSHRPPHLPAPRPAVIDGVASRSSSPVDCGLERGCAVVAPVPSRLLRIGRSHGSVVPHRQTSCGGRALQPVVTADAATPSRPLLGQVLAGGAAELGGRPGGLAAGGGDRGVVPKQQPARIRNVGGWDGLGHPLPPRAWVRVRVRPRGGAWKGFRHAQRRSEWRELRGSPSDTRKEPIPITCPDLGARRVDSPRKRGFLRVLAVGRTSWQTLQRR
jgi:hypothetical protein